MVLRIGEALVEAGLITRAQLLHALKSQEKSGARLGRILMGHGAIGPYDLYRQLAGQQSLPFVNLEKHPPNPALVSESLRDDYLRLEVLPWRQVRGVTVLVYADMSHELRWWAQAQYGERHVFVCTSPRDIQRAVQRLFAAEGKEEACESLARLTPQWSAKTLFRPHPGSLVAGMCWLSMALTALTWPLESLTFIFYTLHLFYFSTLVFKGVLFFLGARKSKRLREAEQSAHDFPRLRERDLPVYTVLVPVYREAGSLPGLIDALRALDYPRTRLDVKLIIEEDDDETYEAALALRPEPFIHLVRVPACEPRTKPKACNYALQFARGELLTIYDAEDRPDPDQLRKAAAAFQSLPEEVVCLQARLNYYNREKGMLPRLFAMEYAGWFDYMLRGLEVLRVPIPLGGTSNHVRMEALRALHGWDPYNVTEDADLGIRFAQAGMETRLLNSLTLEEAPCTLGNWLRQRSRWIKGYMQTWLVHMRQPLALLWKMGVSGFLGFQLFIGGPVLVFLSAPLMWLLSGLWSADVIVLSGVVSHDAFIIFAMVNFLLSPLLHGVMGWMVIWRNGWNGMGPAMTVFPVYWVLHTLASFKALWQLLWRPHFWEKTQHSQSHTSMEEVLRIRREFEAQQERER